MQGRSLTSFSITDAPPREAALHLRREPCVGGGDRRCNMDTKTCFKCGVEQPRSEFYRHPQMGDGLLGKCKSCTKRDVMENRDKKLDQFREYDRERGNRQTAMWKRNYRAANPLKVAAHASVNNALKTGRLTKQPCEVCGAAYRIHGHHDDYSKPLDVRWLCAKHHRQHHNGRRID